MKQAGTVLAGCDLRPLVRFFLALCLATCLPIAGFAAGTGKPAAQSSLLSSVQGTSEQEGPCENITLCPGQSYYDTLRYYVWDRNFTFNLVYGPGTFTSEFKGDSIFGYFKLTPQTAGDYLSKFALIHYDTINGHQACDTLIARIHLCVGFNGQPVTLKDTCFSGKFCAAPCPRVLNLPCLNPGGGELTFTKISGPGSINSHTGQITYTANASGVYNFLIAVSNGCYSDTASICDSITINKAPVLTCPEPATFHTCKPDTFCTTLDAFDPELGNLTLKILHGNAYLTGSTLCVPVNGSGQYAITVSATDSCGAADTCTFTLTVDANRPPYVTSADDFSMTLCAPEEICFNVNADDPDLNLANVLSNLGHYNSQTHQVCFTPDTAGVYTVITTATDSCGASDSDTTLVTVHLNTPPVVSLGDDINSNGCGADTICIPVSVTDDNLQQVIPSLGSYNPQTHQLCFTAEQSGQYQIVVRAIDQCGAEDADTINVNVLGGAPPVVSLGADVSTTSCGIDTVCVPVHITGGGTIQSVTPSIGTYNAEAGEVCFTTEQTGSYQLIVRALGQCGTEGADTVNINVGSGVPPFVSVGNNNDTLLLCTNQTTICIPVETVPGAIVQSNIGSYNAENGTICFEPIPSQRTYVFIVSAQDSCGREASDTSTVYVLFSPLVHQNPIQTINQCAGQQICLPIGTNAPFDSAVASIGTFNSETREWCYTPASTGFYTGTVTLYDSCGAFWIERFSIAVTLGAPPQLTVENDTVEICQGNSVCVPVQVSQGVSIQTNLGAYDPQTHEICFVPPQGKHEYAIIVTASDSCNNSVTDTALIYVNFRIPYTNTPTVFNYKLCAPEEICLPIGPNQPFDSFVVASATPGTFNPTTKQWCFTPDHTGNYNVLITFYDSCGAFYIDDVGAFVTLKHPPVITPMRDTSLYLCYPTNVCLPIAISDMDNDIKSITVNRGQYKGGSICFVPYGAGTYPIIVTVTDSCGAVVKDTANVVITTDQSVHIIWPHDTTVMVCDNNTFCFPVGGIPAGATVTATGIGVSWNAANQTVCLTSQCAVKTKVTVKVSTACNTFTGIFNVDVKCNDAPLVILPPDYTTGICGSSQICVPVGISDMDHNIKNIVVTGGSYDAFTGRICFTADTMGTYRIFASATDSCGKYDADTLYIHVNQNTPPVLTPASLDTTISGCSAQQQICIPLTAYDGGQAVTVVSNLGTYANGLLCFTPQNGAGTYQIRVIGTDVCGASDTSLITVHVQTISPTDIQCPTGSLTVAPLCAPGQVCVPLVITGGNFTVTPSQGAWANNQLCFIADSSGTYQIRVIAAGVCNSDTCNITVPVIIQSTAEVTCPGNSTVFLCTPDTLCFDITKSASVTALSVNAPAYVNGSQVCIPILQSGSQTIRVIGTSSCGADTCIFTVNATVNRPPVVSAGHDTTITLCALQQICLPISYNDPDPDTHINVVSSLGTINGAQVCFTPSAFGQYTLVIRATDSCGLFKSDTALVNIVPGSTANITCPGTQFFTICGTDTVCINLPITPANAQVSVSRGTYSNGHLCIPVSNTESFSVRVIANAMCDADTCNFTVNIDKAMPPSITCPGRIDTTLCLVSPDTICVPVTVTGTGVTVTVQPSGYYSGGYVCVPVAAGGTINMKVIGTNMCGADTCATVINVTADTPPSLTIPADFSIERCPDDTTSICVGGIFGHDSHTATTLTKICGPGTLNLIRPDSGGLCFRPNGFGSYQFCISASDGCDTTVKSFSVNVTEKENCDLCVQVWLESGDCTPVGLTKSVDLMVATNDPIGGFDILLKFDASALLFQNAIISDGAITGWEYFTYRLNSAACNGPCPGGLVRLIGIADVNNGAHHPPASSLLPNGRLARLQFLVANDQNLGDQFVPIMFTWYDCGDNSFSNTGGTVLYIDSRINSNEGELIWDESDNIHYPEVSRPLHVGAPDYCLDDSAKTVPLRCIEFNNGGICIVHPDSIDARGDINLNEVPFEIADAVLYSNYFVHGLRVFTISVPGQIAASDINRDGLTLTVSDLVLLIRIITGDAPPTPKINPNPPSLVLNSTLENGNMTVATDAPGTIGGVRLVYNLKGNVSIDVPHLARDAQNMDMLWSVENGQLSILISKMDKAWIESGKHSLIDIPVTGDGELELVSSEVVDYQGQPYAVGRANAGVPANFALSQNYPNPFNPTTTISFALPNTCEWKLKIYNVTGAVVREFRGNSQAGEQKVIWDGHSTDGTQAASGIYFYRLEAGTYSASKKMVLLK